jgi:uncharacterized protein YwqG
MLESPISWAGLKSHNGAMQMSSDRNALEKLRRKKAAERARKEMEQAFGDHLEYLDTLTAPAMLLEATGGKTDSKIGGLPALPANVAWPEWNGEPMAFLCQLCLEEIADGTDRMGLPQSGVLFFFYDQEQATWGFDPKDKGSWQVIYSDQSIAGIPESEAPEGLDEDYIYREKRIAFVPARTYPDYQDERINKLGLDDLQGDRYIELCHGVYQGGPAHQMFGHPSPVQGNDMDLECQLASNGLFCGDSSGYEDPRAQQLEASRSEWKLLLQLDSDDDTYMMWGDCGRLYFWIRQDDLAAKRFENCWMVLQCS